MNLTYGAYSAQPSSSTINCRCFYLLDLAVVSSKARGASARVVEMVHTISTRRSILAREFEAFISIMFAMKPFPARSTFAGVAIGRRRLVKAGRPVETGIVVDALIDVDLAERSSPT